MEEMVGLVSCEDFLDQKRCEKSIFNFRRSGLEFHLKLKNIALPWNQIVMHQYNLLADKAL